MSVASTTSSTVSSANYTSSSSSGSGAATDSLMSNYNMFLNMLTTQLRTQNPLDPMDASKFTEQLVQYSSVEQQITTNSKLQDMLSTMISSTALSLVNYLGKEVTASSDITKLEAGGTADWKLTSSAAAEGATITIRDASGAVVRTMTQDLSLGEQSISWDGKTDDGTAASSGNYSITVDAKDSDGNPVSIETKVTGEVTAIDTSTATPYLKVNGVLVPLANLISIGNPDT